MHYRRSGQCDCPNSAEPLGIPGRECCLRETGWKITLGFPVGENKELRLGTIGTIVTPSHSITFLERRFEGDFAQVACDLRIRVG